MPSVIERLRCDWLKPLCVHALAALALVAAACGDASPPRNPVAPGGTTTAAALAGNWSGTMAIPGATGTLRLTLAGPDPEGRYVGTWAAVFPDTSQNRQGSLTAEPISVNLPASPTFRGLIVTLRVVPPLTCASIFGEGGDVLTLFAVERSRLQGSGQLIGCEGQIHPTRVELTR